MMSSIRTRFLLKTAVLFLLTGAMSVLNAQSGRLEGTVRDAQSGEPLTGVNIVIEELTIGAASNLDGYFTVINIRPGNYTVKATYIGFTTITYTNVRINIGQTTTLDFAMREEVFQGEEVTVVAERPLVQRDVSSSQVNLSAAEIRNLPVTNITGVVGLQAGVQGLAVRGGASDEVSFSVNGLTLRDDRDKTAFTAVSITSISEIQVQTGGFNAEFGDVQSGIVNVVTKEGNQNNYEVDVFYRHDSPENKHFGPRPNHPNNYWMRPFLDPEVAFTGTSSWDPWTRRQYPSFAGWNAASATSLSDPDITKHFTPTGGQQIFLWQHRKDFAIQQPDYVFDGGFGGPVPFVSRALGNARFWASYRRQQSMYMFPLSEDRYSTDLASLKVTSDIRKGMKFSMEGFLSNESGTNDNNVGQPGTFISAAGIASATVSRNSFGDSRIFSSDYFAPTSVKRFMIGGKLTHTLSARSFYEVSGSFYSTEYSTNPGRLRDSTILRTFGTYEVDEAPFGFYPLSSIGVGSGMRMGIGMSNSRDSSQVGTLSIRSDFTSQLNRYNQIKFGAQYVQIFSNVNYGSVDIALPSGRTFSIWDNAPIRAAAYLQNKFEYEGIVANIGMRFDYSNANTEWYEYDTFDPRFNTNNVEDLADIFDTKTAEQQFVLSPRVGISFPITVTSKLYFNYGHFQAFPSTFSLYQIERSVEQQRVSRLANPELPLQKTVSYELGYEQGFRDEYLLRLAAYYKDESNLVTTTIFRDNNAAALYTTTVSDSYRDTKGLEMTLSKPRGNWFSGFVNYTYMIRSTGRFGFVNFYEATNAQRTYERNLSANAQSKPRPQPYARANLDFFTPADFGPKLANMSPLADWRITMLGSWSRGSFVTWYGGGGAPPGISNNLQWKDNWALDMRLTRTFRPSRDMSINFFVDVNNVLNRRQLSTLGFVDGVDLDDYYRSLHLPAEKLEKLLGAGYLSVPGGDRPGDYRKPGVAFQPIVATRTLASVDPTLLHERPLYFNYQDESWYQYRNGAFVPADPELVERTLKNKSYIDMPNLQTYTFFNPRNVLIGVRISF
jgi:hypothetical protein